MIVEPDLDNNNSSLPHYLQFLPKSIHNLKTIDEYGQYRNIKEHETVGVIIKDYPNGLEIDHK